MKKGQKKTNPNPKRTAKTPSEAIQRSLVLGYVPLVSTFHHGRCTTKPCPWTRPLAFRSRRAVYRPARGHCNERAVALRRTELVLASPLYAFGQDWQDTIRRAFVSQDGMQALQVLRGFHTVGRSHAGPGATDRRQASLRLEWCLGCPSATKHWSPSRDAPGPAPSTAALPPPGHCRWNMSLLAFASPLRGGSRSCAMASFLERSSRWAFLVECTSRPRCVCDHMIFVLVCIKSSPAELQEVQIATSQQEARDIINMFFAACLRRLANERQRKVKPRAEAQPTQPPPHLHTHDGQRMHLLPPKTIYNTNVLEAWYQPATGFRQHGLIAECHVSVASKTILFKQLDTSRWIVGEPLTSALPVGATTEPSRIMFIGSHA